VNILKLAYRTLIRLVQQIVQLPQTITEAVRRRQQQTLLDALEVERLDRIRNPEKYRGK